MRKIEYKPIGIIHTPFKSPEGTPIQPTGAKGIEATVELFEEYAQGLNDLDGFSHIHLLYHCHLSKTYSLNVVPFLDTEKRGLFSTRAPSRPNPIGLSVVQLLGIENNVLRIMDIDVIDGTPLLDIKPYVPEFDVRKATNIGWLGFLSKKIENAADDGRFSS
jgi:tRNA-Thr(GGU) m(6)t(6)A37 methyltransferase TsaA